MFDDTRNTTARAADPISIVLGDLEEWLRDNGYQVAEVTRSGPFECENAGYALGGENDGIVIGFSHGYGTDQVIHSYSLEELWTLTEEAFRDEIESMQMELATR